MVKNTTGGNKHKGQARKFANPRPSNKLRIVEEEGEIYGQVTKLLGNGMCHIHTLDGTKMLCIIRGKFRGRGKRDNTLKTGTWILVGIREWEEKTEGKNPVLNKCDLLEVYSDLDKEKLKSTINMNWRPFIENDCSNQFTDKDDEDSFQFSNEEQEEYKKILKEQMESGQDGNIVLQLSKINEEEEEINIDDI
jgi:initiation factor 1A